MKRTATLAVIISVLFCGYAAADGITHPMKWSQFPETEMPYGFPIQSNYDPTDDSPNQVVMDDWMCLDGLPVTDVHWWGSYMFDIGQIENGGPLIEGFLISIHTDIPAEQAEQFIPSHPGELIVEYFVPMYQVFVEPYDEDALGFGIYQYFTYLPEPFEQEQGTIYWLNIVAVTPEAEGPVWGWHTAQQPHNIDDAVIIYDYDYDGGTYTLWEPVDFFTDDQQYISLDMAFELSTIPEPSTIITTAAGIMILAAIGKKALHRH